jgi:Ca2+-binding RTX toxin-like protein
LVWISAGTLRSPASFAHSYAIADFEVGSFGGQRVLYSASAADGGLSAFSLSTGQGVTLLGEVSATSSSGTYGITDFDIATIGGVNVITPAGRYDDEFAFRKLTSSGGFSGLATIGTQVPSTAALSEVETLSVGGQAYLIGGRGNAPGLEVFAMTAGPSLQYRSGLADTGAFALGNVADMSSGKVGGQDMVFVASTTEHGITALRLDATGFLAVVDTALGQKNLGISQPHTLDLAVAGGQDYLLVGAAESNNLSVFHVETDGSLSMTDMVWDTLYTRFQGVTALESFSVGGRGFVLAGGHDGGMALFELDPTGKLRWVDNILDTAGTTLDSVSAIQAVDFGTEVQVFVSSTTEGGFTQFTLNFDSLGAVVNVDPVNGAASGGSLDDLVVGTDNRDILFGNDGNDMLIDGQGIDELHGGAGADTFVLVRDGTYDRICDFQLGVDKIDLSDLNMLYTMRSLDIEPTAYGARISFRSEVLLVQTDDGRVLTASDFSESDFLF